MIRRVVAATFMAVIWVSTPAGAVSDTEGGGSFGNGGLGGFIDSRTGGGGSDSGGSSGGSPGGGAREPAESWVVVTYEPASLRYGIACPSGTVRVVTRYYRDGRAPTVESVTCGTPPPPSVTSPRPTPPPPPPPPTYEQVRDAVPIPRAPAGIDPRVHGLVGLDTRLWSPADTELAVTVDLGGATVTATASAVAFRFDMGDGSVYESTQPGAPGDPAAVHTYRRHGTYDVALTVTWAGSYTFVDATGATVTESLGTVDVTEVRPYRVLEAQAVRRR